MAEPRPDKVAEVEALEERLRSSTIVILTDYRGLTVGEIGTLRGKLRGASLEYRVAKNTLLSRAAAKVGVRGLDPHLSGPTAVVFGKDDPGIPARLLQDFIRQFRKLEIKGGVVDGHALDAAGVQALATLPSKPELLARVVGAVQGPLFLLVMVLSAAPRGLVTALDAIRKKREAEAPVPATPARADETAPGASDTEAPAADAGSQSAEPAAAQETAPALEAAPAEPAAAPAAEVPADSKPTT
ncbi:MAG TPA: 50S ribosomal protein L10 [bacterium]|nr:50S ribosomal protein L10 [bacterium]